MASSPNPDAHASSHQTEQAEQAGHTGHAGQAENGGHLAHHFESPRQQLESARLGMWIFIATEVLFFGGLLCAYSVYRVNHPEIFIWAHHFLDKKLGALNTIILICSSLTAAWAVRAAQLRQGRMLRNMLVLTLLFATGFLGIKYTEYSHKWKHGLLWAGRFDPHLEAEHGEPGSVPATEGPGAAGNPEPSAIEGGSAEATREPEDDAVVSGEGEPASSPEQPGPADQPERSAIPASATGPPGLARSAPAELASQAPGEAPRNARIFFSIYFLLTGLHGIHVLGGMAAMIWLLARARRGDFAAGYATPVDMVALYWHLVDLIWIYLFLLLYLIH